MFMGPGPLTSARVSLSDDQSKYVATSAPAADGMVVFRSVPPGRYRLEARHPKGLATFKEVDVDGLKPVFTAIGLNSPFLYIRDDAGEPNQYFAGLEKVFGAWREGVRLAWVIVRSSSYESEVMAGIAGDGRGGYLAFTLHASARVDNAVVKRERRSRGEQIDEYLQRAPDLEQIKLTVATHPVPKDLALGITCTWRKAIENAVPAREVAPEVLDGVRYSIEYPSESGQLRRAETETLTGPYLTAGPRTRTLRLLQSVHALADGHISVAVFNGEVADGVDPDCKDANPGG